MSRPLFLTGLARGGTNLLTRMLIAGGASRIAIHAFQPWFKALRNALVLRDGDPAIRATFDPKRPFGDGYFNDADFAAQKIVQRAILDVPFMRGEWPQLLEQLYRRASDEAVDLCPGLVNLAEATDYHEMMDLILRLILDGHEKSTKYVGLIDTWIIDSLPALARAYPDSRFLIVIRDPRAVVASHLKFLDKDPASVGHVLSIVRQWRKYVAVSYDYLRDPLFADRLKLVRYEDQVSDPKLFAKDLCEFLDLPFRTEMVDFSAYLDPATKKQWQGNSVFDTGLQGFDPTVAERWRQTLARDALIAVEYCCALDMSICGYPPIYKPDALAANRGTLAFLIQDGKRLCSWRTDTGDAAVEYARETSRRALPFVNNRSSESEIQKAFLSSSYFDLVQSRGRLFPQ